MPASTLEPVSTALRNALAKNSSEDFLSSQLSSSSRRVLCTNIEFEPTETYQNTVLNNLKSKYIVLQSSKTSTQSKKSEMSADDTLTLPQKVLYPLESVQLGWNNLDWSVGTGMVNLGNTCYLNSTLQALFHVPALVNWLLSDKQHMMQCEEADIPLTGTGQGGCIICAMSKTLQASQQRNTNAIRPWLILSKLRIVCRHLVPGRQEDAHEFLRYLVDAMERAYLQRFRNISPLDTRSKETTPLNQILGGYLRSAVRCLECGHVSTTFQHFQDLLLDIRKVNTLDDALDLYFSREKLDDMAYHCENCQKKVLATKQFSLERAPMVLCIQLKRFSVTNNKITKHVTFRQRLELTRFARRKSNVPLVYRLASIVTHVGQTVGCGHYTAVAQAPSGNFYHFDDSMVRPISTQAMFGTNAYIILYELECSRSNSSSKSTISTKSSYTSNSKLQNSDEIIPSQSSKENTIILISNNNTTSTSHVNGICKLPSANPLTNNSLINNGYISQNGNGKLSNGNKNHSNHNSDDSDSGNSSGSENDNEKTCSKASPKSGNNSPKSNNNSPNSSLSSYSSNVNSPKNNIKDSELPDKAPLVSLLKKSNQVELSVNDNKKSDHSSQNITKLVPYEVDDSSSSTDDSPQSNQPIPSISTSLIPSPNSSESTVRSQIVTKAGSCVVSTTKNSFQGPSLEGQAGWNRRPRETVSELMHMSHEGYSAPISTWNGARAALDREINYERRENRKRQLNDNNPDKNKSKQPKHSNSYMGKSNPGYNPFQEYNNSRKWQPDSHYYNKSHYNNGMNHRYQRRGNYHNNNRYRDKFRH